MRMTFIHQPPLLGSKPGVNVQVTPDGMAIHFDDAARGESMRVDIEPHEAEGLALHLIKVIGFMQHSAAQAGQRQNPMVPPRPNGIA